MGPSEVRKEALGICSAQPAHIEAEKIWWVRVSEEVRVIPNLLRKLSALARSKACRGSIII